MNVFLFEESPTVGVLVVHCMYMRAPLELSLCVNFQLGNMLIVYELNNLLTVFRKFVRQNDILKD